MSDKARTNGLIIALSVIGLLAIIMWATDRNSRNNSAGSDSSRVSPAPTTLTTEQREGIHKALQARNYSQPISIEITDTGWLVTTFGPTEYPADSLQGLR